MKTKEILKDVDKLIDKIQLSIEEAKSKNELPQFDTLLVVLELLKKIKTNVSLFL